MTRRFARTVAAIALLWAVMMPGLAAAAPSQIPWKVAPPPSVSSGAAVLLDWRTGEVLYQRNGQQRRDPASTTKVLTAIIALERAKLTDQIKISRRAAGTVGSSMHIRAGDVYSLHDLLHGLLLRSGNDAATAIAEHVSGSVEAFAELMTVKAKEIGAVNSHFANPHGLTDPRHYSTAYDLALIARYALQNETFRSIVAMKSSTLTYENLHRDVVLNNTNALLSMMAEADGVKTGTTAAAGQCLIASATRDEQKLVAVVLHAGNRWTDSYRLLSWGFDQFRLAFFGRSGEVLLNAPVRSGKVKEVPVAFAQDLVMVMPRKPQSSQPEMKVEVKEQIGAPIRKGQRLGKVIIQEAGKPMKEVDLVAARDVPPATVLDYLYRSLTPLLKWISGQGIF